MKAAWFMSREECIEQREREIERENIVSYCHFWVILLQCVVVQICTGQKSQLVCIPSHYCHKEFVTDGRKGGLLTMEKYLNFFTSLLILVLMCNVKPSVHKLGNMNNPYTQKI